MKKNNSQNKCVFTSVGAFPLKKTHYTDVIGDYKSLFTDMIIKNLKKKKDVALYIVSGEANAKIWNPLKQYFEEALTLGLRHHHILGPIVSSDGGVNYLLDYPKYSKKARINGTSTLYYALRRELAHWLLLRIDNGTEASAFLFHGEKYHRPHQEFRYKYEIRYPSKNLEKSSANVFRQSMEREFENKKFYVQKIKKNEKVKVNDSVKSIRDLLFEHDDIKRLYEGVMKAREEGKINRDFDELNAEELLRHANEMGIGKNNKKLH